jgi:enterobactin synthetase component D / holo-[acyl-carrier protein] synthase
VIEKVLPVGVAWAEEFGDRADAVLFPDEAAAVARAVDRRRREFATGRSLAREALAGLGMAPASVPPGERGAPRWPPGVIGSITHCTGYRAAAVARADRVRALGIDAEPDGPLPEGVLDRVSLPGERAMLRDLAALRGLAAPGPRWDLLLFSAKESVYKAWFPMTGRWLGFEDAELTIDPGAGDPGAGTFAARILVPDLSATDGAAPGGRGPGAPVPGVLSGRWLSSDGILLTAVTVAQRDAWRLVLERVLDVLRRVLDVLADLASAALDTVGLPLGLQVPVTGGPAYVLLGLALGHREPVAELVHETHVTPPLV